ncbi:MAG TPA: DNA polymerase Y family protein [Blastocatellia bacterium]|nr:DNA polymerase Y family protein [Blastocatellia bacterium]
MFACIHTSRKDCKAMLMDCAYAFSPLVEETADDTVVLDIEGCELLFGSHREIAKEIARYAAGLGLKINVAVAQNPDAAIHAAKCFSGVCVIAPGKEAARLGELPLAALDFTLARVEADRVAEILETLDLWGIRNFRDFAALPEAGVSERLGPEGARLQRLARGESDRPLSLSKPAPEFEQSIELDDPIELLEPLSFILARLLNQLCASLQAHGLAVNELRVRLMLEDRSEHERAIRLPFPMRDGRIFLKLLLLDIESHPPKCAIVAMSIACEPTKSRAIQNGLFQPLAPEPEKLELTLARLARLVGEINVGSVELIDTHRPDAFRIKRFTVKREVNRRGRRGRSARVATKPSEGNNPQSAIRNSQSLLGFRLFRPPLCAEVEAPCGWPARIKSHAAGRSIRGKIIRLAGPWRTSGDWWSQDGWARDEWDVAVAVSEASPDKGTLYRIYRDLRSNSWFVEGIYD